ncbi:MAG: ribulose-phosphate 3-epimerase [Rickettsiales bacterium]|jgi:ribulose-phosphate 3-epimerase|nr:ribulose-phosphate 3-epimerase [Rickettsiales bacterium]
MNLFDSSFLCLDIGSSAVRAVAHRVRSGRITKSAFHNVQSDDTAFAIKSVIDELEKQIGARFDSAFITGNFGKSIFEMTAKSTDWNSEHKITASDIGNQIAEIAECPEFHPMHIIPLRYDTGAARNLMTPVGNTDRRLASVFGAIFYENDRMNEIYSLLRKSHIQAENFLDPHFLLNMAFRERKQTAAFIDFGAEFTSVSIWTDRGPVFFDKIPSGQESATRAISGELDIDFEDARRIKHHVSNMHASEMDRFTPADSSHDFSRADMNEILLPIILDIIAAAKESLSAAILKYSPSKIFISGGGSAIPGMEELVENTFGIPVKNIGADAAINALSDYVWNGQAARAMRYAARREKFLEILSKTSSFFKRRKKKRSLRVIPVMPSTLAFDMRKAETYELFKSAGIEMIHVDIMDGFFVDRIAGGIDQLNFIRQHTSARLYVHLMTESPAIWAQAAANAGADTIVVSTNTAGVRAALRKIKEMGKKAGIALNPESSLGILKPVLKEIDDILVMSVAPGAGGQEFDDNVLNKISVLANTRKKYGLKYKISVDGGINPDTAQKCWTAGADFLISGSYLARSADFPLAVQSLLPQS